MKLVRFPRIGETFYICIGHRDGIVVCDEVSEYEMLAKRRRIDLPHVVLTGWVAFYGVGGIAGVRCSGIDGYLLTPVSMLRDAFFAHTDAGLAAAVKQLHHDRDESELSLEPSPATVEPKARRRSKK